jgi:hypothetical protein
MTKNTQNKNTPAKRAAKENVEITETVAAALPVVGANPAQIPWPSDKWGLTKDFRAAVAALGQRTGGQADKRALVEAHMEIALLYLTAKYAAEQSALAARLEKYAGVQQELTEPTEAAPEAEQLDLFA